MDTLINLMQQATSYFVPFVILLGLLIFVHELGHFLVAKYFGVRVEVFSLGFGKKLFQFKRGDTVYCISLIPFGGYVKMYGDELNKDIPEEEKKYSFLHKPVGQRIGVVLAGPLMNFFFAILLFTLIALVGEKEAKTFLGRIEANTKASQMGLSTGDQILAINNTPVETWSDVQDIIQKNAENKIEIKAKSYKTGEEFIATGNTELVDNPDVISSIEKVGSIEGLQLLAYNTKIGISNSESLASKSGLVNNDNIVSINGQKITRWYELLNTIEKSSDIQSLELEIERTNANNKENKNISINISNIKYDSSQNLLDQIGIESTELYLGSILAGSAAEQAGLKVGDRLYEINGEKLSTWHDLVNKVKSFKKEDQKMNLKVLRDNQIQSFDLSPTELSQKDPITGMEKKIYAIGVTTSLQFATPDLITVRTNNPIHALSKGIKDTWHWCKTTVLSFVRLAERKVSASNIGGPIMIGQLASETFKIGLSPFMKIMAIISINLFILNLLPIPVLDGGHLLFYIIEAIRGAPLSLKNLEIAQTIGLFLLLSLMAFALFNDVSRVFGF